MKVGEWGRRVLDALGKYKYVLLVALVGALLLLWPQGEETAAPETGGTEDFFAARELEGRLEKALSQVEGAGKVTVVLTLAESPRRVLARDGSAQESETVTVSRGAGAQEPVELQQTAPAYRGALVVADGGDDPQVKLKLCEAVSALTGLGADKISICKGK